MCNELSLLFFARPFKYMYEKKLTLFTKSAFAKASSDTPGSNSLQVCRPKLEERRVGALRFFKACIKFDT